MKLALDLTHSSHSSAQTGIQQVARGLWKALPELTPTVPVAFDKYAGHWREADQREREHLDRIDAVRRVRRKRPHWSSWQRVRGRVCRRLGIRRPGNLTGCQAALVPEFFAEWVGPRLPELKEAVGGGPLVAVFHDAIAWLNPGWGVPATIERYPQYLAELSTLDGVACVSGYSRRQLARALGKAGLPEPADVRVIPLGLRTDHLGEPAGPGRASGTAPLTLLNVATIEPRKNHASLLQAAESLWDRGWQFRLVLVGMVNRGSGRPIEDHIRGLQARGRPLDWKGSVSASELADLYRSADATLFPSLCEGYGIPVLESLWFNKPCLASNGGALAEVVPGGGTLMADPDAASQADMLERFLSSAELRSRLAAEADHRQVRTMRDYAGDLLRYLGERLASGTGYPKKDKSENSSPLADSPA